MDETWAYSFLHVTELYLIVPNVMDLGNFSPNVNNPCVYDSWNAKLKCKEYFGKNVLLMLEFVTRITLVWIQNW
jgi:hypothetical protein